MSKQFLADPCGMPSWSVRFSPYLLPTAFVYLKDEEIAALAAGETVGEAPEALCARLKRMLEVFPFSRFVGVDRVSPTDTDRFRNKRGAVHSAASAWNILCESEKVRREAAAGRVSAVCVRAFRRLEVSREFRLFVYGGELTAMSQYHLTRYYGRLEGRETHFWDLAQAFVRETAWLLPAENAVMDIYVTSDDAVLLLDLNDFGAPTDPLMLKTWERDWSESAGLCLVPPPKVFSGEVNVSF